MNGSQRIMITDGGHHSPESWAVATADHLVYVGKNAPGDIVLAARKLETAIADALIPHHAHVQTHERGQLAQLGDNHHAVELDPTMHVEQLLQAVVACAVGTKWEEKFKEAEWQNTARGLIASHIATSMHNERADHAQKNPGPHGKAYLARHYGS